MELPDDASELDDFALMDFIKIPRVSCFTSLNSWQRRRTRMPRDFQRQRVYDSENVFWGGPVMTLSECQEYVDSITRSAWWRHRGGLRRVYVIHGTKNGRAWASYDKIKTSPDSRKKWAMLHELAHILTPSEVAAHGPEYCANYVAIVRQFMSKSDGDKLRHSFREHRVKVRGAARPRIRRVHCTNCDKQVSEVGSWRYERKRFCTKRCGKEWLTARLVRS